MITIIDYGMGNLGSIRNTLQRQNIEAIITSKPEDILKAEKIILPGVGSFDRGMYNLKELGLLPALNVSVLGNCTPILGICLGMQLLSKRSEEGRQTGLQWIDAETVQFRFENGRKIPHMGWNDIKPVKTDLIIQGLTPDDRFYFAHSYHISKIDDELVIGNSYYGYLFPSLIRQDNIIGIQCHPERSHKSGIKLLRNFLEQ